MIRLAQPTAVLLCAALGLFIAGPVLAQQTPAADQTAPAKKKAAKAPDAAAADKSKPAEKNAAAKPLLVASFGDWGVYQTQAT
ncbi:MAG: hypothetical protein ACLPNY_04340, partial [Roseiarcus sp.]